MFLKTKTYAQMIEENKVVFPSEMTNDEPLKELIFDWFQFMNVVDDDKFPVFFKRQLSHDYRRYTQLLRVEPGYAEYDWLVKNYHENKKQKITEITNNGEIVGASTGTRGSNTTRSGSANVSSDSLTQDRGDNTRKFDGATDRTLENKKTGNDTAAKTGTETTTRTPNLTTTNDLTETRTLGQSIQKTTTSDTENSRSSTNGTAADVVAIEKVLPQDPVNAGGKVNGIGGVNVFSGPDFTYASGYNENTSRTAAEAEETGSTSGTTTETTTPLTGSDTVGNTGTVKTTGTEASDTTFDTQDSVTYNSTVNDVENIVEDNTDKTTFNTDRTETKSGTKTLSDTAETETTNKTDTTQTENRAINSTMTDYDVYTGRDEAPAEMLTKAVNFILRTDAWEWLKDQLMVCFLSTYDI